MVRTSTLSLALALCFLPLVLCSFNFVHPGIGWTLADIDYVKAHANDAAYAGAYNQLLRDGRSTLTYVANPPPLVTRGEGVNTGLNTWRSDMQAVHQLVLVGYFKNDTAYYDAANKIMLAYAANNTVMGGIEIAFDISDYYRVFSSLDLLKLYSSPSTVQTIQKYIEKVWWPSTRALLDNFQNYSLSWCGSQGQLQLNAATAIAIYLDDEVKLRRVVNALLTDPQCGFRNVYENGQYGDMGRDMGHAVDQLEGMIETAEMLWGQGIDIYSLLNNRILSMAEYNFRWNLGFNLTSFYPTGCYYGMYTVPSSAPWRTVGPAGYVSKVYHHYVERLKLTGDQTYYTRMAYNTSGGIDYQTIMSRKNPSDNSTAIPVAQWYNPPTTSPMNISIPWDVRISVWMSCRYNIIAGSSVNITASSRGSCYVSTPVTGDFTFTARLASFTSIGNASAGAGLLVRSDAVAGWSPWGAYASLYLNNGAPSSVYYTWAGGLNNYNSNTYAGYSPYTTPIYFKIERRGQFLYQYASEDGIHWVNSVSNYYDTTLTNTLQIGFYFLQREGFNELNAVFDQIQLGTTPVTTTPDLVLGQDIPSPTIPTSSADSTTATIAPATTNDSTTSNSPNANTVSSENSSFTYQPEMLIIGASILFLFMSN